MFGGLKRRINHTALEVRQRAEDRVARLVKDATPEGVARRPGESVPVWGFGDESQRRLAAEIDGCYGNGLGGVDRGEISTFKAEMAERIAAQRQVLATCRPGSTAHQDTSALIRRWEEQVQKAEAMDRIIQQSDVRLLLDVAGMVQRQSSGVIKALAGTLTEGLGQVASRVQVNLAAELGAKKDERP